MNPARNSEVYREVADMIGEKATDELCRALGGTRVFIPRHVGAAHPVADVVGIEAAKTLAERFGGDVLKLPKGYIRRERVLELHRRREAGERITNRQIALATDYSERQVEKIVAEHRQQHDDGQMNLFD